MAMLLTGGGRYGRRREPPAALAEINVTPFVDVVLVLLIIFMLTAHVMEYGIEVEVPKTKHVASQTRDLPVININKTGEIYLNRDEVNINELPGILRQRYANQPVYLRADRETPFDPIAQVMSELGDAKIAVNVVTQPYDPEKGNR